MNGVRFSILRAGILILAVHSVRVFAETPPHVEKPAETVESSFRRAAEAEVPTEKQKVLAEKIAKDRKDLIENLAKATTPETKEKAAIELRKALGDDPDGKTLKPQLLSDLVEALKKAESATDKDAAVKNLMKSLSYSGEGEDLTPKILHDQVEKLKKAQSGTKEEREAAAKAVLKALGPDGLNHFKKDGKIDMVALADALELDKEKEKDSRTTLAEEEAKARKEKAVVLGPPAPPEAPAEKPVQLDPAPNLGGNQAKSQEVPNTGKGVDNGPNIDTTNVDNVGQQGLDQGLGANQVADNLANLNQNEIDRLNRENELQRRLDEAERQRDEAVRQGDRNQGDRINAPSKTENPEQPIQPPSISTPGGGSGSGGGQPPQPPPPVAVPTFPAMQLPPPPPAGNDNGLIGELFKLAQGNKTGESSGEWMAKMTADLLGMNQQNMTTLLSTITTIGQTMARNVNPGSPALTVARTVGQVYGGAMPNLYGKNQRVAKTGGPRSNGGPRSQVALSKLSGNRKTTVQVASRTTEASGTELRKPLRGAKRAARAIRK